MKPFLALLFPLALTLLSQAQEKPRVFVNDSTSWEASGGSSDGVFGGTGGARPQTAEIIKTFTERCPAVTVNNRQDLSDYVVVLDHEGGKSWLQHKNKVAVFARVSGDAIVSKSTFSLGASVQEACDAITKHWTDHSAEMKQAAEAAEARAMQASAVTVPAADASAKTNVAHINVTSLPDGSDIEVDGSFVGNTPSAIELPAGDHSVTLKKAGYKDWQRKIKITGGDVTLKAELEKNSEPTR